MTRRGALCSLLFATLLVLISAPDALALNPIQAENALPGDNYWSAAVDDPISSTPPIDGYASASSVRPGEAISFQVSTAPVARYRIEISRLGWYGGAGGRRVTCLVGTQLDPTCSQDRLGVQQAGPPPPDPQTGEIRAGWTPTDAFTVPSGWTSGYYLAVFRLTSGPDAGKTGFAPFIVQAPVGDHAQILVQVPSNTWQAYNAWGGEDLYTTPRAVKVSFDRPYSHDLLFKWEYPLIRYLERGGWDVSYATDDDVSNDPGILLDHSLDMSAGHDEYWTKAMRDGWEAARAAGVNLAFMGANDSYWQVRYEDGGRTMVGYKSAPDPDPDPSEKTTEFRRLVPDRSECQLLGVEFQSLALINRNIDATADPNVAGDSWFSGTGITPGSVFTGLGGGETDGLVPGCHVPPVTPLLHYSGAPFSNGTPASGDAVRYTACSGAEVFSGGSLQFSWGLDGWRDPAYTGPGLVPVPPANAGLQHMMANALADLTRSHVPRPGPPRICVPTAGISLPDTWLALGQRVQFDSTATDPYGQISSQQWRVSLGRASVSASGPSVTTSFRRPGTVGARLVVADSSGASSSTLRKVQECPCPPGHGWGPGAQTGPPCQLMGLGTLQTVAHRLSFVPNGSIGRFSLTSYRVLVRRGRIGRARLGSTIASSAVPLPHIHASVLVNVSTRVGRHVWSEELMAPYDPAHPAAQPGLLVESLCDGTSGRALSPVFGGPGKEPLRLELDGTGRFTVSVTRAGARKSIRQLVTSHRRVVVTFGAQKLARGIYRIVVSQSKSRLQQPLRLTAVAL